MSQHNNFKAGLFVIAGLGLILVIVIGLSDLDGMFTPMRQATIRYGLADGLQGLKVGAPVTIGDVPAGEVVSITDAVDPKDPGRLVGKDVTISLPEAYKIYDNLSIELVVPPLGSGTKLNIRSFGHDAGAAAVDAAGVNRQGDKWLYEAGEVIHGGVAGSALTANLVKDIGIEDAQRAQIQGIIADVKAITGSIASKPETLQNILANVEATTASLKTGSEDLKVVLADVRTRYTGWLDRLDSITARADTALTTINGMLEENRPVLKNTLAEAESTLKKADDIAAEVQAEWLPRVKTILEDAKLAVSQVRDSTTDLRSFVAAQLPVLERAPANMRLTSDQLKLTAIEVRRSPWRLLYEPGKKELETDNLYDAARSFALAAGSLESSTTSLNAVLKQYGERMDADDPNLKTMLENLHQTFEKFSEAEKKFWDVMNEQK